MAKVANNVDNFQHTTSISTLALSQQGTRIHRKVTFPLLNPFVLELPVSVYVFIQLPEASMHHADVGYRNPSITAFSIDTAIAHVLLPLQLSATVPA